MADDTRDGGAGREAFDDLLPVSARRRAPGEYEILASDGSRLWYMEGAALAEWVCSVLNAAPVVSAVKEWREAEKCHEAIFNDDDLLERNRGEWDRRVADSFVEFRKLGAAARAAADSLAKEEKG